MVYCGKLSKACLSCRKRKLRCDLRRGGCTQCARAQLTCSDYRDTKALRVRDESSAVRAKAIARKPLARVPRSLSVSINDHAKDLFYHSYVVGATKPFDFLLSFHSPTCKGEHLNRSVEAVALAYLHYQRPSPSAEDEARQQYISALSLTSAAVRDPGQSDQDSTILAILLLDLYEKITGKEPAFHEAWAAHLSGALALVKLRDDQQFTKPSVLRMLTRLSTNLLISCVASDRPVCDELVILRSKIAAYLPGLGDPKWQESDLMIEFASLRQQIKEGQLSGNEAVAELVSLDAKFMTLARNVPPTWRYVTIRVDEKTVHHYDFFHHIHPAEHIAQMWNTLRLTRILLNELICSLYLNSQGGLQQSSKAAAMWQRSMAIIKAMALDICASLPQFLQETPHSPWDRSNSSPKSSDLVNDSNLSVPINAQCSPMQHLPCYRLIFPLYVAAQSPALPAKLKRWVVEQLHFIADYHAIKNAAAVAKVLEAGERKPIWHVYAMLGSYAFVC